jgi:N-acetyl-gamma-glutamyl-phosphate reductase
MINTKKINAAVVGASGFTGEKLIDLLLGHPNVAVGYISAQIEEELPFSRIFPAFKDKLDIVCRNLDVQKAAAACDIVFLALPHKISLTIAPLFLEKNKIVIDLSADYRLKDSRIYEEFYGIPHTDADNLEDAVYGLPEFYRSSLKSARLIANPGCYPTVSILSIAPLLKEGLLGDVIIDAKSGITGAGRKASLAYHYAHLNGNLFGYKPFGHQHLPEINQVLSHITGSPVSVRFTPHVVPVERGILATIYGKLIRKTSTEDINAIYRKYYQDEPFVRFFGQQLPQLKNVVGSNFCDIGLEVNGDQIVVVGTVDNLIKGASGQAVQNMNIILGLDEKTGLW